MKYTRLFFSLLALALIFTLSGCDVTPPPIESGTEPPAETVEAPTETEKIIYTHCIAYKEITFLSEADKEAWREPLLRLFRNEAEYQYDEGKNGIGFVPPDPSKPSVRRGYHIGLFDINADGTPELLINMGGGSAGNAFYEVFDILTGEQLGSLDGGFEESWCVYLHTPSGKLESIGQFEWRGGWQGRTRYVRKVTLAKDFNDALSVYETEYMTAGYWLNTIRVEVADEESETGVKEVWDEVCSRANFFVNGDSVDIDTYFNECDRFQTEYVRIPETALQLVYRSDYEDVERLVDDLLALNQAFIRPASVEAD